MRPPKFHLNRSIDRRVIAFPTFCNMAAVRHLSFFLIWGDTRSLRMPALRPASQAGPMRNAREGTSVVLRDTTRLT